MNTHHLRYTIILAMLVALGPLATDLYLPAMPALANAFAVNTSEVQLTLSVYMFGFAIGQLVYGPLSDRFGRKPILFSGLILFVVSSVAASLAGSIEVLITVRLFQALGGCAGPVLGRAMVRDLYNPVDSARVLSHIGTAMALAPAIAPIVGGVLTVHFGWEASFWFLFGYGIIALGIMLLFLPETNKNKNEKAIHLSHLLFNYLILVKHPQWRLYTLTNSFIYAGLFSFISVSSFVIIDYLGVAEQHYGYLFAIVVTGYIIGTQLSAKLVRHYPLLRLIQIACSVSLLAGISMLAFSISGNHSIISIIAPFFFFMTGVGIVMPLTMAGALAPFPHIAGSSSALFGMCQMLTAAALGGIVGHFHSETPTIMAAAITFCGVSSFICMLRLRKLKLAR